MIVEDEGILIKALTRLLLSSGYGVTAIASSGEEAVLKARETTPDLILMDIKLEGEMDGIEAARQIRAHQDVAVVYLTAHSDKQVVDRAKMTEPHGYLTKPVSHRELDRTVEMALYKHRIEKRLRESEEKFRQLAENIDDAFWLTEVGDPRRIAYLSPSHESVWGTAAQELYANPNLWVESLHLADRERVLRAYADFLVGSGDFDAEYRIVRPDGAVRWIWDRAFPIRGTDGSLHRVAGLAQDITQRKLDQEKQQQLNDEIRHFAYIVSHDLRAPLINLRGFVRELNNALNEIRPAFESGVKGLRDDQRRIALRAWEEDLPESLGFIDASVTHMDHLINAILMLGRLGRRSLDFERLDMNQLARQIFGGLAYEIGARNVKVTVADLPDIVADRTSVEQIMSNLLSNALKYGDPDRPLELIVSASRFENETLFRVQDTGRGIDKAHLAEVFQIFRRVGNTEVPGEGMGLAYVRTLVRRHRGRIWCESEPGVGSTFIFTISNHLSEGQADA
jgi:PAS domain S-box-containing protein